MARPTDTISPAPDDDVIASVTNGTKWDIAPGGTLNWALSDGFEEFEWTDPSQTSTYLSQMFASIEIVIDVNFEYVGSFTDEQTPVDAADAGSDLTYIASGVGGEFSDSDVAARSRFPYENWYSDEYAGIHGDNFFNYDSGANYWPYDPGSAGFSLLLHETGHALGLKHPHDDGGTGRPTFDEVDLGGFDYERYFTMSYNDELNYQSNYNAASPMPYDVVGLQYLYGKNMAENAGDTVHSVTANDRYQTVWDAGGTDAVSAQGASQGWEIHLPDALVSQQNGEFWGVAEPNASAAQSAPTTLFWLQGDVENAVGSVYGDTLAGNRLANQLQGRDGNDVLEGAGANDSLAGGLGADQLDGGKGRDTAAYNGSGAAVVVSLAKGTGVGGTADGDTLSEIEDLIGSAYGDRLTGDGKANLLQGRAGDDTLLGYFGDDLLRGEAGNDTLFGYTGADVLIGGADRDVAFYGRSAEGVSVSLAKGSGSGGTAAGDRLKGVEDLVGSDHRDRLTGDATNNQLDGRQGNDTLSGYLGDDVLNGQAGNDVLFGYTGADVLSGGKGRDMAFYGRSDAGVAVNLGNGTGSGGSAAGDTLSGIEDLIGSVHRDVLTGSAADNRLEGLQGNDTLSGFLGDDVLKGQAGNDVLFGYLGADVLSGGQGRDMAFYGRSGEGVSVSLAKGTGSGGTAAGDRLHDVEDLVGSVHPDRLVGDSLGNSIEGRHGNDTLLGYVGDDLLKGQAGNDFLYGYTGADVLSGGQGRDTAFYGGSDVGVRVSLAAGLGVGGTAEGDTLYKMEDLIGSQHGDTLVGDNGDNTLAGRAGNDILYSKSGTDALSGGTGRDTFVFSAETDASTVTDWQDGLDVLDLGALGFANFDQVFDNTTMVGDDLRIDLGGGRTVDVVGLSKSQGFDDTDVVLI